MANENVEGSAANVMAGSHSGGRGAVKDWIKTVWGQRQLSGNSGNSSGSSSSSSSSSGGQGGDEWTAERYKNHNEYKENEHRRTNESKDSDMIRHNTNEDARMLRKNTNRDAKHLRSESQRNNDVTRNNTVLENAKKNGQVSSIDLDHTNGRQQIRFNDSPVRQTTPGKGKGAQGTSKQQTSGKGAAAGKVAGAVIAGAVTKNPRAAAAGGAIGAKVGDAIEKKVVNRGSKSAVKPGTTAGAAASYITPSNGKKLAPEAKAQNAAARSYVARGKKA